MGSEAVEVDAALVEEARRAGAVAGRSTASQLARWARLGRAVEASGTGTNPIAQVLDLGADFDDLSDEDQATVAAVWSHRMDGRLRSLDMAARSEKAGVPYAELVDGDVVVRQPPT